MELLKIVCENFNGIKPFLNGSSKYVSNEKGLITVVVGWDLAKKMGATILDHKINENTYWTFLPTEKRKVFEEHLKDFKKLAINKLKSSKKTININPLSYNNSSDLLEYIKQEFTGFLGYLFKDKLYIYNGDNIYHLDMSLLYFMSWDIFEDIKDIIKINKLKKDDLKYGSYFEPKYIPYLINAKEDIISGDIRQT